jgi:hypothetical protein
LLGSLITGEFSKNRVESASEGLDPDPRLARFRRAGYALSAPGIGLPAGRCGNNVAAHALVG